MIIQCISWFKQCRSLDLIFDLMLLYLCVKNMAIISWIRWLWKYGNHKYVFFMTEWFYNKVNPSHDKQYP